MSRKRSVMWAPCTGVGLEHLSLAWDEEGIRADGVVIGTEGRVPFRVRYEIRCDPGWRLRELAVYSLVRDGVAIELLADGKGNWTTPGGEPVPALDGCVDVDISATPFTNTLPIRRLDLRPDEASELAVAYVAVPEMQVAPARQRYACLESHEEDGLYRYESLDGAFIGFTADLTVDTDGLVLDYPELFRRVRPG